MEETQEKEIQKKKKIVLKKKKISLKKKSPEQNNQENTIETNTVEKNLKKKVTPRKKYPKPKLHKKSPHPVHEKKPVHKAKNGKFLVRVCTSLKSCGDNYGQYIWERMCNEHDIDSNEESFTANGIEYEKSQCQGYCKKKSNVQVIGGKKNKTTQFHYMTPIKGAKLIQNIERGANPENIKRL